MVSAEEAVPENGVTSSSSSTSSTPIPDPPPPLENRAVIDILERDQLQCDESFSEIIKKDEEEEEVVLSDACSNNCTGFALHERKRLCNDDEDVMEAVSDVNKSRIIHEEEGETELDGQNGNQESELADEEECGNKENNNGEEEEAIGNPFLGETNEDQNGGRKRKRPLSDEDQEQEVRENAGSENNVNDQNESVNQESEGVENDENQKENEDNNDEQEEKEAEKEDDEEQEDDDEERRRRAPEKGKRPMSIWNFKFNYGHFPYPHSEELHNHIIHSIPNLQIGGEHLTDKIMELENNFNISWELEGDNPQMERPVDREIYDLSMSLWGNSEDNVEQKNKTASPDDDWSWI
ncbi:unnamed protein product [Withania somnifera]